MFFKCLPEDFNLLHFLSFFDFGLDIGFSPSEATEKIIQEEGEILTACLPRNQAGRTCTLKASIKP